jgi:hypothetical protein
MDFNPLVVAAANDDFLAVLARPPAPKHDLPARPVGQRPTAGRLEAPLDLAGRVAAFDQQAGHGGASRAGQ